ncbi:MAG: carboxymuconolactone decarboxylase family protein [Chloroflexi bacterium]|nr:carboxymuconolactone decarboxylase family protein [Chloroflexota bacterium]
MRQIPPWMKAAQDKDPEFCNIVSALMDKANSPGALDAKTKTLITMAIDAAIGQRDGVKSLAARARSQGASEAEIAETLRISVLVRGLPALITGTVAYE